MKFTPLTEADRRRLVSWFATTEHSNLLREASRFPFFEEMLEDWTEEAEARVAGEDPVLPQHTFAGLSRNLTLLGDRIGVYIPAVWRFLAATTENPRAPLEEQERRSGEASEALLNEAVFDLFRLTAAFERNEERGKILQDDLIAEIGEEAYFGPKTPKRGKRFKCPPCPECGSPKVYVTTTRKTYRRLKCKVKECGHKWKKSY